MDHIAERLTANRLAYGENSGDPGPFIWTLVQNHPSIGDLICRRVIDDPTGILHELVPVVLGRLADALPHTAMTLAHQLMATDSVVIQRCVAQAFGWGRGNRVGLIDGEANLLRSLIRHDDVLVRRLAIMAARTLSGNQRSLALELITSIRFSDSGDIADEVAGAINSSRLSWTDLSAAQADGLLAQLRACPRIDGYQVVTLLGAITKADPQSALDLLESRVEAYEQQPRPDNYESLPHIWHKGLPFREAIYFADYLRSVIDWMAEGANSWYRQREGAEIFAVIAERFDEQVIGVIAETIETGDKFRIKAVGAILRKAPENLVWDDVDFVTHALRAANKYGEECVQAIGGGFHAAVTSGGRWGTPGQPFQQDIDQRDKSITIAARLPPGSIEQRFYRSLQASAESRIRWEEEHDRDFADSRDW